MKGVFELMTEMNIDTDKQEAWRNDPDSFLKANGMTAQWLQNALIASRAMGDEIAAGGPWKRCAACGQPGPDEHPNPDPPPPPPE